MSARFSFPRRKSAPKLDVHNVAEPDFLGRFSPREIDALRHKGGTWLALVEQTFGRAKVPILHSVRDKSETEPPPRNGFEPGKHKKTVLPWLERGDPAVDRVEQMRHVRAFIHVDDRIVSSPHECVTYVEAIESAAFELMLEYARTKKAADKRRPTASKSTSPRATLTLSRSQQMSPLSRASSASSASQCESAPATPRFEHSASELSLSRQRK